MKFFVPDIRFASELPAQQLLGEKLGGAPWGLPSERWPACRACGKAQSLLAQLAHHPERLDLGRDGRILFLFQCAHDPGSCETWSAASGANACVIVEPEDIVDGPTPVPEDDPPADLEVGIVGWLERHDDIPVSMASSFFDSRTYSKLPEETLESVAELTRFGSVPSWVQSPDEAPKSPWRFVGQLDGYYSFFTPPRRVLEGLVPDRGRLVSRTHLCPGPNFGDAGIGYLFLKDKPGAPPEGSFFWQCG